MCRRWWGEAPLDQERGCMANDSFSRAPSDCRRGGAEVRWGRRSKSWGVNCRLGVTLEGGDRVCGDGFRFGWNCVGLLCDEWNWFQILTRLVICKLHKLFRSKRDLFFFFDQRRNKLCIRSCGMITWVFKMDYSNPLHNFRNFIFYTNFVNIVSLYDYVTKF
jgi:hypothetical protein